MFDALVIGGGPAGLQAALTLGRMHRTAVVVDSGSYRNGTVDHAHNFITHDGRPPADIRRLALADVAAYPSVEYRTGTVASVTETTAHFVATVDGASIEARTLILATGLKDTLPQVPGLAEAWGREVASCPFCHGHEFSGRPVGLLGSGPQVPMLTAMLAAIASEVVRIEDGELARVERVPDGLRLTLADRTRIEVAGLFVHPELSQAAPFAEQLGLAMLPSGCIRIDALGSTSNPRVFAAGDLAHVPELPAPMAAVLVAAAAGLIAAASVVRLLAAESESGRERP